MRRRGDASKAAASANHFAHDGDELDAEPVIWAAFVERHPKLRSVSRTPGGGLDSAMLDRMSRHFDR